MPSHVGVAAISTVHWVSASTKTRSKNSSRAVTRSSSRRTAVRRWLRPVSCTASILACRRRGGLCSPGCGDPGGGCMAYPFVESPNRTRAPGRAIGVVVIHTMEIAERPDAAEICARWFKTPVSRVSAHYCVDADSVIQWVRETEIAWHARGGDTNCVGVALAGGATRNRSGGALPGFRSQTRRDWADPYSAAVLDRAANLVADVCRRRRIPVRWVVADDLVAGRRGLTGHNEVSEAFEQSDHWDPGDGFPVEAFVDRLR